MLLSYLSATLSPRRPSFAGGLLSVMPSAERCQIGFSMIVTGIDVVDVGCPIGATFSILELRTAIAVSLEDALPDFRPVGRKSGSSI
jgi:hypothetical protein